MLSKNLLSVSALILVLLAACEEKDDQNTADKLTNRPEIPLNSPTELLGSWQQCHEIAESQSSGVVYLFKADGSLEFKTETYKARDCSGTVLLSLLYKGSYVVGSGNALDITFPIGMPESNQFTTQYRVFSVQGETLLISNNAGLGADAANRDYDLDSNSLRLTKTAL